MTSPFRWVLTAFRDLGLNVFGFLPMFAGAPHHLDLRPGVGINGALGRQCPAVLEGGHRGAPEASS